MKKYQEYTVIADFPAEEILQWIDAQRKLIEPSTKEKRINFQHDQQTYSIKAVSLRYGAFIRSRTCAICGCEGTIMRLEHGKYNKLDKPHFNLYGHKNEKLIMLTADHIKARALGGLDDPNNLQTMCFDCNQLKAQEKFPSYIVLDEYPVEQILNRTDEEGIFVVDGKEYHAKLKTTKLDLFRTRYACEMCGRLGRKMRLEQEIDQETGGFKGQPFFNLYARHHKSWTRLVKHHIIPGTIGGRTTTDNLLVLCEQCNTQKSSMTSGVIRKDTPYQMYEVVSEFPAAEILTWLSEQIKKFHGTQQKDCGFRMGEQEYPINFRSKRYRIFCKNPFCVKCGLQGTIMRLERAKNNIEERPHFNLYGMQDENLIQMTIDHKVPRSKKGTDRYDNLQTMCYKCNQIKGNIITKNIVTKPTKTT